MSSVRFLIVIAFVCSCCSWIGVVESQSTNTTTIGSWSGCVNPNEPNTPEVIQIGKPHTICLTLGQGGNWAAGVTYGRYTWRPVADQYSRFHIPDCT
jgi:hypothetical protein